MQEKKHYKMYKDGKHWVIAAVTVAAVGLGTMVQGTVANADTAVVENGQTKSVVEDQTPSAGVSKTSPDGSEVENSKLGSTDKETGTSTDKANEESGNVISQNQNKSQNTSELTTPDEENTKQDSQDGMTLGQTSGQSGEKTQMPSSVQVDQSDGSTNQPNVQNPDVKKSSEESAKVAAKDYTSSFADYDQSQSKLPANLGKLAKNELLKSDALPVSDDNFSYTYNSDGTATVDGLNNVVNSDTLVIPGTTMDAAGKQYTVTAIAGGAFASSTGKMEKVTKVVIGDGIKSIGDSAFAYLTNLQVVDLSENHTLETIGNLAFVSNGISSLVLPETVTSIGDQAFKYARLTTVYFPASLTSIGTSAFESDSALADVTFAGQPTDADLTIGEGAFRYDGQIKNLELPANLVTIGKEAFFSDNLKDADNNTIGGLSTVTFGSGSRLKVIGESAFIYDSYLQQIDLPDSVTTIGFQAFLADSMLNNVALPASLESIGDRAFIYDDGLTTVKTDKATKLTTIGNEAFEFSGLTGSGQKDATGTPIFVMPQNVQNIGNNAFNGSHLTDLELNQGLQTIGNNAFSYNTLSGKLVLPDTVTTVGNQAFYGNRLIGMTVPTTAVVGADAFSANRITQLATQTDKDTVADKQFASYFGASGQLTIDTLFDTQVDQLTNKNLVLTGLTNEVTYDQQTGKFTIPKGVTSFNFTWSLPDGTGKNLYAGTYQVVLNDPVIEVKDGQVWYKDDWTPEENVISADLTDGTKIPYSDLNVSIVQVLKDGTTKSVNASDVTKHAGTYKVTYSADGLASDEAQTITLIVNPRTGTYTLTGDQAVKYSGTTPDFNDANYQITMSDGFSYIVKGTDLEIVPDTDPTATFNVGTHNVRVKQSAIDRVMAQSDASENYVWVDTNSTAKVEIEKANITVSVANADKLTKVAGEPDPKPIFTIANGNDTQPLTDAQLKELQVTYSRASGEMVGTYDYRLGIAGPAAANYNVTYSPAALDITAAPLTIDGEDATWIIGTAQPTAVNFAAKATDENKASVPTDQITVDLSQADLTKPGEYTVVLSYGNVKKTVTLKAVAPSSNENGNHTIDPGNGNNGSVVPSKPVEPTTTKPAISKPTTPKTGKSVKTVPDKLPNTLVGERPGNREGVQAGEKGVSEIQPLLVKSGVAAVLAPKVTQQGAVAQKLVGQTSEQSATTAVKPIAVRHQSQQPSQLQRVSAARLPQTSEAPTAWWALLGTLFSGLSLVDWCRKHHES